MVASRLDLDVLLDAAADEFALHGFEGMSMRTLAERCSATVGALYYHFSSKQALYEEVCQRSFDSIVALIETALQSAETPEDRLVCFVSTLFDTWDRGPFLILTQRDVINSEISADLAMSSPHYRLLLGLIRKIQSQFFQGEIDEPLSYAIGSMVFGYSSLLTYSQRESGLSVEEHKLKRKAEMLQHCRLLLQTPAAKRS